MSKGWLILKNITVCLLIIVSVIHALLGEYNKATYELLFVFAMEKL